MKAISLKQPWADFILKGVKTIETRTWATNYRGDLLICSSQSFDPLWNDLRLQYKNSLEYGRALCIVELYGIRPMIKADEEAACCGIYPGAYSWLIRNIRPIKSFPVKGALRLFEIEVPEDRTAFLPKQN